MQHLCVYVDLFKDTFKIYSLLNVGVFLPHDCTGFHLFLSSPLLIFSPLDLFPFTIPLPFGIIFFLLTFFFFGSTIWLAGSNFPNQGLNLGP